MKNAVLVLSGWIALFPAEASAADQVTASGCAVRGVEGGCTILTENGKTYNISSAKPSPVVGKYGVVKGQIFDGMSTCQQGIILSPSTWTADLTKSCPK